MHLSVDSLGSRSGELWLSRRLAVIATRFPHYLLHAGMKSIQWFDLLGTHARLYIYGVRDIGVKLLTLLDLHRLGYLIVDGRSNVISSPYDFGSRARCTERKSRCLGRTHLN